MAQTELREKTRTAAGVSFAARLAFDGIHHAFPGGAQTLRGVSLSAEPGEVLCLLGPSGSGKTTLLRIASGIEPQTSGTVTLNDRIIAGPGVFLPPEKRSIGLVFQDFALFPHLTILENVRFGLTAVPKADGLKQAHYALERVGLDHMAEKYPHALSGGEQQRVALARALAPRPGVLLLDEPFSGLDSRLRDNVRSEILQILRQSRATAIVVTHDAEEAMRMGDRIALMKNGQLVQAGRAQDLYLHPVDLFAAAFFSELNIFHGKVASGRVETPVGTFDAAGLADGVAATVAVRTTGLDLDPQAGAVKARVLSRHYLGVVEMIDLALQGYETPVRARVRAGETPAGIKDIWLTARTSDVLVFESRNENA